jgi:hypothetical protein
VFLAPAPIEDGTSIARCVPMCPASDHKPTIAPYAEGGYGRNITFTWDVGHPYRTFLASLRPTEEIYKLLLGAHAELAIDG